MAYETPLLISAGSAQTLVLGSESGMLDNPGPGITSGSLEVLGLDD